ncbi:MAG: energy transducer TonB [Archangiaceae bacterium]|nr:energy transducer TonB [Archangiaceae bacterium]
MIFRNDQGNCMPMPRTLLLLCLAGCATTAPAAGFREAVIERPALPASELFKVCWPEVPAPGAMVKLNFLPHEVLFEATDNSTGRCMREIAETYPWGAERPSGELTVPPGQPTGWAVLAWVKLLSSSRFGPERGLLDPAPHVAACLARGGVRPGTHYAVRFGSALTVGVLPAGAVTDTERCVEAVLGATAWPSTRQFTVTFDGGAPSGAADASFYFASEKPVTPIDPQRVHDALMGTRPAVGSCWEAALNRRAGLSGGRTVRISVGDDGAVTHVSIAANASEARATAADYLLDRCLVQAVKGARFGPGAGDTAYSWVFGDRAG